MGQSNIGDHAVCRLGNLAQLGDFSLVVGPHFHKGEFSVHRHGEQREGHANVVVQVAMGSMHIEFPAQYRLDELFGGGFAIAACESKYRCFKTPPVGLCQALKGLESIVHRHNARSLYGRVVHHSSDAAFGDGLMGKGVAVETLAFQGDVEQSRPAFPGVSRDARRAVEEGEQLLWRCTFHGDKKQRTPIDMEVKRGSE